MYIIGKKAGFTTIELLIAIAVLAVLAALAVPSFQQYLDRSHLRGATEAVYEQLQYARSQAIKRSVPIIVDIKSDNTTTWALGMTDDPAGCDASDAVTDPCDIEYDNDTTVDFNADGVSDKILTLLESDSFRSVTMRGASGANSPQFDTVLDIGDCPGLANTVACFEPQHGLARPTTDHIELEKSGYRLQVRVAESGRVTICRPQGAVFFAGYDECPD